MRRSIGKIITRKFKSHLTETAGPLQLAAGHLTGAEANYHKAKQFFENEKTDKILLEGANSPKSSDGGSF